MPELASMFQIGFGSLTGVVLRTLVVYVALLIGLRLAGKRELGQMTPFDLVVVLVISNAVQNAMVGSDNSLTGGIAAAFTLLIANYAINWAGIRWPWIQSRVIGSPSVLIIHGEFVEDHMKKEGLQKNEVMMAIREHGIANVSDVDVAVLEVDGTISVVPMTDGSHRTRRRVRGRKPLG